jgi:uncharacterized protein YyaL (SSP411 family)
MMTAAIVLPAFLREVDQPRQTDFRCFDSFGNAMATQLLLRLHHLTGDQRYYQYAEKVLRSYYEAMENQPYGFAHLLCALDFYLEKPKDVVMIGERDDPGVEDLLAKIRSIYQPNMTIQLVSPRETLEKLSPLLRGKSGVGDKAAVYVCQISLIAPVTAGMN